MSQLSAANQETFKKVVANLKTRARDNSTGSIKVSVRATGDLIVVSAKKLSSPSFVGKVWLSFSDDDGCVIVKVDTGYKLNNTYDYRSDRGLVPVPPLMGDASFIFSKVINNVITKGDD